MDGRRGWILSPAGAKPLALLHQDPPRRGRGRNRHALFLSPLRGSWLWECIDDPKAHAASRDDLGAVQPPPRHLSSATPSDRPWRRSRVAKLCHEEPDAGNPHVRICGGPGRVTGRVYPILPGAQSPLENGPYRASSIAGSGDGGAGAASRGKFQLIRRQAGGGSGRLSFATFCCYCYVSRTAQQAQNPPRKPKPF